MDISNVLSIDGLADGVVRQLQCHGRVGERLGVQLSVVHSTALDLDVDFLGGSKTSEEKSGGKSKLHDFKESEGTVRDDGQRQLTTTVKGKLFGASLRL